jgi:hypothetical protein
VPASVNSSDPVEKSNAARPRLRGISHFASADHESFADPINLADPVFHERVERRVERLEQRERSQTYFIQRRANDPWLERTQIGDDLGKLRHDGAL